jgi:hypothetical protein
MHALHVRIEESTPNNVATSDATWWNNFGKKLNRKWQRPGHRNIKDVAKTRATSIPSHLNKVGKILQK